MIFDEDSGDLLFDLTEAGQEVNCGAKEAPAGGVTIISNPR